MAEVTPLRPGPDDDEPELQAVREAIRASRRRSAWWLLATGVVLIGGGLAALLGGGKVRGPSDEAESWVASIVLATGGGAILVGFGLLGMAVYVLVRARQPRH